MRSKSPLFAMMLAMGAGPVPSAAPPTDLRRALPAGDSLRQPNTRRSAVSQAAAPGVRALERHQLRLRHALTDVVTGKPSKGRISGGEVAKGPAVTLPRRKGLTHRQEKRDRMADLRAARDAARA